jgi:molybdate/tungstate transport system ATP-binding protein
VIAIEELAIDLGEFSLRDVNLTIEEGEYVVLLGPTGAGKTVLVECLVGIHRPRAGRILIDGQEVTDLYPEERNVGFVPQDYALFPNMTVRQNMGYGLAARRFPARTIAQRTDAMLQRLELTQVADRFPLNLSGGERQRVALGRALITEPGILLLDEPLSALDESLRSELARQLRRIQQQAGSSFLHVCHSFEEASEVADRVAIMHRGTIEQVGTIQQILLQPTSLFVARFTRTRNLLEGVAERSGEGSRVTLAEGTAIVSSAGQPEGPVVVGIRPEEIAIDRGTGDEANRLEATITALSFRPRQIEVELDVGVPLVAYEPWGEGLAVGQKVTVQIRPERVLLFAREERG